MRYEDPLQEFASWDKEMSEQEKSCYWCERRLKHERAIRIMGELMCMDCADEHYGEEID